MAEINLSKTVITAPIDGVVTARDVAAGQTVSANFSAPTLFVLATDLTALEVVATVDEADAGLVAPGQPVTFRVDAYPSEAFHGSVVEERLNAATVDNVVTYATIIDAPNPDLRLKPGMTATVAIEVARRDDVLRASAAALKFKPDAAALTRFTPTTAGPPPARSAVIWTFDGSSPRRRRRRGLAMASRRLVDPPRRGTQMVTREVRPVSQLLPRPPRRPAAISARPQFRCRPLVTRSNLLASRPYDTTSADRAFRGATLDRFFLMLVNSRARSSKEAHHVVRAFSVFLSLTDPLP